MRSRKLFALLLFTTCAYTALYADNVAYELRVRDTMTHLAVKANVTMQGAKTFSAVTDDSGYLLLSVPADIYQVTVSAAGYKTVSMREEIAITRLSKQISLLPLVPASELRSLDASIERGHRLLYGYAVDAHGHGVAGVRVRVEAAKLETRTQENGFYSISIPTMAGTDTLVAAKAGYKTIIYRRMPLQEERPLTIFLDMQRGTGEENFDFQIGER